MMLDRSESRIWAVALPRGVDRSRMVCVYSAGYTLSTARESLDVAGCNSVYISERDEVAAASDEEATENQMILPPPRSTSGRAPDRASAQSTPDCALDRMSLVFVAAGAILWASDVFFRAGLVRHGLSSSATASPQMANQVLREYVPKMSSQVA